MISSIKLIGLSVSLIKQWKPYLEWAEIRFQMMENTYYTSNTPAKHSNINSNMLSRVVMLNFCEDSAYMGYMYLYLYIYI